MDLRQGHANSFFDIQTSRKAYKFFFNFEPTLLKTD
jgi:hypothetical protein